MRLSTLCGLHRDTEQNIEWPNAERPNTEWPNTEWQNTELDPMPNRDPTSNDRTPNDPTPKGTERRIGLNTEFERRKTERRNHVHSFTCYINSTIYLWRMTTEL
jgi:hypothetical protein